MSLSPTNDEFLRALCSRAGKASANGPRHVSKVGKRGENGRFLRYPRDPDGRIVRPKRKLNR
jgi:hypothetical protein